MARGAPSREGVARCLDDETLALLLDGSLDDDEDALVRAHLDGCDDCRRLFADAARAGSPSVTGPTAIVETRAEEKLRPGIVVTGKYRIERAIGEGGMGTVLAARHLELAKTVALKVLRAELADDLDAQKRFAREARAAASLRSDNAVRIFDVDRLEDGRPFLVMEYLEGCDLATKLELEERLSIEDAVGYLLQACDALAEAHELGIVHRDLKPHNLFLTKGRGGRDVIKVLDFGLAKALDTSAHAIDQEASMTGTNVMLGSPFFMSPEQCGSGRRVDVRSDIWSLGATLYHLVSGTPPFVAPTIHLLCARILKEDFRPIRTRRPDAPPALEMVLRRCMSREPDDRYATVGELANALQEVLDTPVPSDDTTLGNATTLEREALAKEPVTTAVTRPIAFPPRTDPPPRTAKPTDPPARTAKPTDPPLRATKSTDPPLRAATSTELPLRTAKPTDPPPRTATSTA
ncbi:MAG TPA: serine/threonine-protein kinase, partial [Labilithrix sp.]